MKTSTIIEISPDQIEDVETFDELLREVHGEYTHQPDARMTALQDLIMSTTVVSGETMSDAALRTIAEEIETPQAESRRRAFKAMERPTVTEPTRSYIATYDQDGNLENINILTRLPEDKANTNAGHRLVMHIPSGHKQNDSSFTTNIKAV